MTAPSGNQLVLAPENVDKIQRTGNNVIYKINRVYTKHQDIHDQESFRKSGLLYSPFQSPIQSCMVTASDIKMSSLLNREPLKHSKKSKIFFAISLNLLVYYGH